MNTIRTDRKRATRLRWAWRAGPLIAALVAIPLLAGCGGGGSSGGNAQAASSSSSQKDSSHLVRYAQCMRAHGVTNFPDPTSGGGLSISKSTIESPQFQTASEACRSLAPGGGQSGGSVSSPLQAQALQFAHCMRSHGVPAFPDPSFTGGAVGISISRSLRDSPSYMTATQACRSLTAGWRPSPTSGGGS